MRPKNGPQSKAYARIILPENERRAFRIEICHTLKRQREVQPVRFRYIEIRLVAVKHAKHDLQKKKTQLDYYHRGRWDSCVRLNKP